jgi:molybdopterin molybdotransferase
MVSVTAAEKQVLDAVVPLPREDCPLIQAHGRVLRQTVAADRDLPPFDRVALDGYALRHLAWQEGTRRFRITGLQAAGTIALMLKDDEACIEVMTGAVLPGGADTVVGYEDCTRDDGMMVLAGNVTLAAGQGVHRQGSDRKAGAVILQPGDRLSGREIAVAAACGYSHLAVAMEPRIAVVATGDELVDVSSAVGPHQIRRSNDYALRAALIAAGHTRVERYHLRDVRQEIEHLLWHIIAEYDVVVLAGGISKGRFDFLPRVLEEMAVRKLFHGVAQRPGKPFWFGLTQRRTPVFGLPGNPASAYICLHRYVLPALAAMSGMAAATPRSVVLAEPVEARPEFDSFLPVVLRFTPRGEALATPAPLNTSGDFAGLVGTDGFVEVPAGSTAVPAGTPLRFWAWI